MLRSWSLPRRVVSRSRSGRVRGVGVWVTAIRCRAALSCRFPLLVILTRPAVLPDQAGIGATPACMAKRASERNRSTPAVSPTILAAVSGPQPCIASNDGARGSTRAVITLLQLVDHRGDPVDVGQHVAGHLGIDAGQGLQPGGQLAAGLGKPQGLRGGVDRRVDPVGVPAEPVDHPGPLGHQVLTPVDQQLQLPRRLVVRGHRKIGFAQHRTGHRERVDRVGLAAGPRR